MLGNDATPLAPLNFSAMLKSYAKINLTIDIMGRENGYHLIDTVMCEVADLFDEIEVAVIRDGKSRIEISTDNKELKETPKKNTAYKAAKLLAGDSSVKITIKKNIPLRSGLGGGSSNAAAVLKELNHQLALGLDVHALRILAAKISMDAPFFITGGIARATHYGEIIEPIKTDLVLKPKLIFLPGEKKSTADMYKKIDTMPAGQNRKKTENLIRALQENNLQGVIENLHNDFDLLPSATCNLPSTLSGSGPTRFKLT